VIKTSLSDEDNKKLQDGLQPSVAVGPVRRDREIIG